MFMAESDAAALGRHGSHRMEVSLLRTSLGRAAERGKTWELRDYAGRMAVLKRGSLRRFHAGAAIFWALMAVPTILWFRDSILWVAFMSLYANFAAEMAAYQGARAEDNNGKSE
jgi:hypothetical protein